jgi:2-dehydro-3-deoxygluconokinase
MIAAAVSEYPNFQVVATTLRTVKSATVNSWVAIGWSDGQFREATDRDDLEILDRIGGGDSFASGLIYGLLTGQELQMALEYGAAHGALVMTTPGDTSMATKAEVESLIRGAGARVIR